MEETLVTLSADATCLIISETNASYFSCGAKENGKEIETIRKCEKNS